MSERWFDSTEALEMVASELNEKGFIPTSSGYGAGDNYWVSYVGPMGDQVILRIHPEKPYLALVDKPALPLFNDSIF